MKKAATRNSIQKKSTSTKSTEPFRFAHPFFTTTPVSQRTAVPGVGTQLLDYIQGNLRRHPSTHTHHTLHPRSDHRHRGSAADRGLRLHPLPHHRRHRPRLQHRPGSRRRSHADRLPITTPEVSPAFFFHLGDVIYGPNKDQDYRPEFYEPYVHYPARSSPSPATTTEGLPYHRPRHPSRLPQQLLRRLAGRPTHRRNHLPPDHEPTRRLLPSRRPLHADRRPLLQRRREPRLPLRPHPRPGQKTWLLKTLKAIAAQRNAGSRKALDLRHASPALHRWRPLSQHRHARRHRLGLPAGRHPSRPLPLPATPTTTSATPASKLPTAGNFRSPTSSPEPEASVPRLVPAATGQKVRRPHLRQVPQGLRLSPHRGLRLHH